MDTLPVHANTTPRKTVVAIELQDDEKFPANFSGMTGDASQHTTSIHQNLIVKDGGHVYRRDPWTHESREGYSYDDHQLGRVDEDQVVIQCKGLEITLPRFIARAVIMRRLPVHVNNSFVIIKLGYEAYILPRDKPHFDHGFLVSCESYTLSENGGVIVENLTTPGGGRPTRVRLLDPETKTMRLYAETTSRYSRVSAYHNGLIWWKRELQEDGLCQLFPTFVDLASPGRLSCGLAKFVVSYSSAYTGLQVVDLASRVVTDVVPPSDWHTQINTLFVGFVKDPDCGNTEPKFQARVMSPEAVQNAKRNIFESHGIPVEREEEEEDE